MTTLDSCPQCDDQTRCGHLWHSCDDLTALADWLTTQHGDGQPTRDAVLQWIQVRRGEATWGQFVSEA